MSYKSGDILLAKYRIEKLIGSGAFAEVYQATHLGLNAPRALKVLRKGAPGLGSSEYKDYQDRFQLEAQLGSRLDNPNIIRVHDFEHEGKDLILVMEYAAGGSLAELIVKARETNETIPVDKVIQIGVDVANGLSAIHALDAVHRDLKPSNILFDVQGRAKVGDLGLAQIPGGPSLRSRLSQPAPHPGTPGYMSPEQESQTAYLKPPSDVYALGLILFEMLTGRNYHHLKPGTHLASLRVDVPTWLDNLLERMLSEEWRIRPWGGAEVAQILQEGLEIETELQREEDERRRQAGAAEKARQEREALERRQAEERARQEAARRSQEISRHTHEIEAAIASGARGRAKKLLGQLERLGSEGQRAARPLRERLHSTRQAEDKGKPKSLPKWTLAAGGSIGLLFLVGIVWIVFTYLPSLERRSTAQTAPEASVFADQTATGVTMAGQDPRTATVAALLTQAASAQQIASSKTPPAQIEKPTETVLPTEITDSWGVKMVLVPAGEFLMGGDADVALVECQKVYIGGYCQRDWFTNEEPVHTVPLDDFYIDRTEVTNAMYQECVDTGACSPPGEFSSYLRNSYYNDPQYSNYPVIWVDWDQARAYCQWRVADLPTEAQWEKAARGTEGRLYPWGTTLDGELANFCDVNCTFDWANKSYDDGYADTAPVGNYERGASPYGALDMAGNVWEWVLDWYDVYPGGDASASGYFGQTYRVLRGGSWYDNGRYLRASSRLRGYPAITYFNFGFRCALSP